MIGSFLACLLLLGEPGAGAMARPAAPQSAGDALLREAKTLRYAQRWFEAAALYRRFLAECPKSSRVPEARFWLAATLEQDQRWDEAAAAYTDFLARHPDQRMLGKEARLNRIHCWGLRQGQSSGATPSLVAALGDENTEVQVAAALQLAKCRDRRAVEALQKGLALPASAEACSLALLSLGVKPAPTSAVQGRFLVIRIQQAGHRDAVTVRLALELARAVGSYLSDAQIRQASAKGFDIQNLTERALALPRGSVLLSVEDGRSSVTITTE